MKRNGHRASSIVWGIQRIPSLLLLGVLSTAILLGVGAAAGSSDGDGALFMHTEITQLESGWVDESGNSVSLPATLPYKESGYCFETVLQSENDSLQCLYFSAKYLNVRLFLDGEEIGSCMCRPQGREKTIGKAFTLFHLPKGFSGSTLRIEAEPLLGEACQYEIVAARIGEGGALLYQIISAELPLLGISFVILCFGFFLLVCGAQSLHVLSTLGAMPTFQANYLHIGLLAILFSLYSIAITDTIRLFIPNSYFVYLMEFWLLSLLPLPLLALAEQTCPKKFRLLLRLGGWTIFLNFILQIVLHFGAGVEPRTAVPVTHFLMVISAALLIPALASAEFSKEGDRWLPVSFLPVLVGALMDICRFYLPHPYQKAMGFQMGVLLFLLLQAANLVRKSFAYYENSLKASAYEQMAYTDILTGLSNRTAFETRLTQIQEKLKSYSAIWCVSADINNLKQTNDAFGHSAGDILIRDAAQILQSEAGRDTSVYRTGGDEFEMFVLDRPENEIREMHLRINKALREYNDSHENGLSIALGYDRFRFSDGDTMAKLLSRADALMYEDKRKWKEENEREYSDEITPGSILAGEK